MGTLIMLEFIRKSILVIVLSSYVIVTFNQLEALQCGFRSRCQTSWKFWLALTAILRRLKILYRYHSLRTFEYYKLVTQVVKLVVAGAFPPNVLVRSLSQCTSIPSP